MNITHRQNASGICVSHSYHPIGNFNNSSGICDGILQRLSQSFVTETTSAPQRGVANATNLLSYDLGIGTGVFLMGFLQDSLGLSKGFAITSIAYIIAALFTGSALTNIIKK